MLNNKSRRNLYAAMIFVCLIVFEFFSYASSYQAILDLVAIKTWAITLGLAFVLVDFGGIGKLFSGVPDDDSDRILAGAWVLSAVGDSFLTFLSVHMSISQRSSVILVDQGVISMNFMQVGIPIFVAILVWMVQFFLVRGLNSIIDELVKER